MEEVLARIYYQPKNLWKGQKAIEKLAKKSEYSEKEVKNWLAKQAFWQIHLPAPKTIHKPHYNVEIPNQLHQFDIMYMPKDRLQGADYKYLLTGIDVASRYKVARPMRNKKPQDVAFLLKHIYENNKIPLTYPETFQCDNGSEFKGSVTEMLTKHGVNIRRSTTKYNHSHTAFVENLNLLLATRLFKIMDAQELNQKGKTSNTWVRYVYDTVDKFNNSVVRSTGEKPIEAIKMDKVPQNVKPYNDEELLDTTATYRYLLKPGEEHGDERRRATDNIWSRDTVTIDTVSRFPGNRALYYLHEGPKRAFVREELLKIPEDTELPPDYVQVW